MLLYKSCLKPSHSLRQQLLLSFGSTTLVTLIVVVITACICAKRAGDTVKNRSDELLRQQVIRRLVRNSRYVSETLAAYLRTVDGTVQLMTEVVQDRIVGYPEPGWEEDLYVPFKDRETGSNRYPLDSTDLRLDWNLERNVNMENINEMVQGRGQAGQWELVAPALSSLPTFFMQGACDPNETNTTAPTYYPNCTDAHNDPTTGGAVQPTNTSRGLYRASADIGVLLKPLFEAQPEVSLAGVYYHNSGAGATVVYPGHTQGVVGQDYTSDGCEWMVDHVNPHTGQAFGTPADVQRCHPPGQNVSAREYNPMERAWCQNTALAAGAISWQGPIRQTTPGAVPVVTVGRGAFDRRTGNFIGCVGLIVAMEELYDILRNSKDQRSAIRSDISIIRYKDNTVFVDTLNNENTLASPVTDSGFISQENFDRLRNGVDFSSPWTPDELEEAIKSNVIICNEWTYTAYPLPPPPKEYDSDYEPEFLVIHAISNVAFAVSDRVNSDINKEVLQIMGISLALGAVGMAVVYVILWFVSRGLTEPLLWIKRVAWGIVNHDDERSPDTLALSVDDTRGPTTSVRWAPKTELSELVREFRAMIQGFSGEGAASLAFAETFEIPNQLTWQSVYQQLYARSSNAIEERKSVRISSLNSDNISSPRELPSAASDAQEEETPADPDANNEIPIANSEVTIVPAPPKKNRGPNILKVEKDYQVKKGFRDQIGSRQIRAHRSRLFWVIFTLIALPLILTNITICWVLSSRIIDTVGDWVNFVALDSEELELRSLDSSALLKASQAAMSVKDIVRDLYFMTRVAGWLLFGGSKRSDSFTNIQEAANDCRGYNWTNMCPVYLDVNRTPCVCAWEDLTNTEALTNIPCLRINETSDSRAKQERFFFCQQRDADNTTGRRDASSFLNFSEGVDDSPESTLFWDDIDAVPGAEKGVNASGFETTYDRIRVSSAMSIAEIPLYNYATELGLRKHFIATYIAHDADGMMTGYRGCQPAHLTASLFQSTAQNRAAVISPELCPLGKFGYDPRCRDWYATGKKKYYNETVSPVYVTAPYLFAGKVAEFAASATAPIVNPETGGDAGQALLDFYPSSLRDIFNGLEEPIAFVITPDDGFTSGDTVVGPYTNDENWTWTESLIGELLFVNETESSPNRNIFETEVLSKMKSGDNGTAVFKLSYGGSIETVKIAFQPVEARVLLPLDPSDLARGANSSKILVYSIGIAVRESDFFLPWSRIEDDIMDDLEQLRCIYLSIIGFVSIVFIALTFWITVKVCKPTLFLLVIVQSINRGKIEDDIPPLKGGSSEVHQVYNSFSKLYKIVRISNVAFFSGNLEFAYSIISDALKLFRKVSDDKAIGIACNNLGNTLQAICRSQKFVGECCNRIPGICTIQMAKERYDEALSMAHRQLDQASSDEQKADFTQQLADRLFNRALFLLLVAGESCAPDDARETALSDIRRVRRMDDDVKDFWIDRKLLLGHSTDYFLRLLQRAFGLLEFYGDDELRSLWDANDLVGDADRFLFAAWDQPTAVLFKQISRIGRLQQLEDLAMRLDLCRGRTEEAACLAMRKFAEDEFLIESSFIMSATVLLTVLRDDSEWSGAWTSKAKSSVRADLRKMLRTCKQENLDIGKCLVFAMEINERWHGHPLLERINARCLELYDESCMSDDFMGLVAYTTHGDLNVQLGIKAENEGRQRTSLDLATTTTSEQVCPSFAFAMQMLIDSPASSENDSFVVVLTDGYSWDADLPTQTTIRAQIDRRNRDRDTKIHVIILGMDVEGEDVVEQCKMMCTLSKRSLYVDIDEDNVDATFDEIGALIRGETSRNARARVSSQGMTMEKF